MACLLGPGRSLCSFLFAFSLFRSFIFFLVFLFLEALEDFNKAINLGDVFKENEELFFMYQ